MPERMLIIDDETLVLESCRKIFSAEGFDVVATSNSSEGLKLASDSAFDIILCDWQMPNFDGMNVVRGDSCINGGGRKSDVALVQCHGAGNSGGRLHRVRGTSINGSNL